MARFHEPVVVKSGGRGMATGSLLGTRVSSEVFGSFRGHRNNSFFGGRYDDLHDDFINNEVIPMERLSMELSRTVNALINPNRFRVLETLEDFQSIPQCMEYVIAMMPEVREGIANGKMDGFDYRADTLPDDDVWGRQISNFACENVAKAADEEGRYRIEATMFSTDPARTPDQLYIARKSRDNVRWWLENSERDPTLIDTLRG